MTSHAESSRGRYPRDLRDAGSVKGPGWSNPLVQGSIESGRVESRLCDRGNSREVQELQQPETHQADELVALLVDKKMPVSEAAERLGLAQSRAYALIQREIEHGRVMRIGRGEYRRPPKAEPVEASSPVGDAADPDGTGLDTSRHGRLIAEISAALMALTERVIRIEEHLDETRNRNPLVSADMLGSVERSVQRQIQDVRRRVTDLARQYRGHNHQVAGVWTSRPETGGEASG